MAGIDLVVQYIVDLFGNDSALSVWARLNRLRPRGTLMTTGFLEHSP